MWYKDTMEKKGGGGDTMEYYSVIKKKEMMPFAATWMDLEIVIQSEVSHRKINII